MNNLATEVAEMLNDQIQLISTHIIHQLVFPAVQRDSKSLHDFIGFLARTKPVTISAEFGHDPHLVAAGPQLLGERSLVLRCQCPLGCS